MAEESSTLKLIAPSATTEEAAAIVAAIDHFIRASTPPPPPISGALDGWSQAARIEAVSRDTGDDSPHPWINT